MNSGSAPRLKSSTYDRSDCATGIVHLGFGAFHRSHQAVYVDRYMQETGDLRWGIAAINLRPCDSRNFARDVDAPRGYVLKTVSSTGETGFQVVRSHVDFADWSNDSSRAERILAETSVRMVTITVTESGYYLDDEGNLDRRDPVIAEELSGRNPRSVYACLSAGLRRRMKAGAGPVSVLCCDNIRRNGRMLRMNLMSYVRALGDGDLAHWLAANASFPCSMVDRITPKPELEHTEETRKLFSWRSGRTVMAEDFIQWVLEDDFAGPRPQLEKVGVTLTGNVDPYEEAKIRILNGGHSCLAYLGALSGHRTFDQAIADPELFDHFRGYEIEEVLPALDTHLPFDKEEYLEKVVARFRNRNTGDSLERICADGFAKFSIFIRPTLEGCFAAERRPHRGIRSVASWYVFAQRVLSGKLPFNYMEARMPALEPLLAEGAFTSFANSELLWGNMPRQYPEFERILKSKIKEVEAIWPM